MTDSIEKHYLGTAYNSQNVVRQSRKLRSNFVHKLLTKGQAFSFHYPNNELSLSFVRGLKPSDYTECEKTSFWNEERLINETFSPWAQAYFIIVTISKFSLMTMIPFFYIMSLMAIIWGEHGFSGEADYLKNLTLYGLMPCIILQIHFYIVGKGYVSIAPFLKPRLNFSLNRKTGMVTLYKKGNEVQFSHPFIEFDCVLMSAPTPQGHLNYSLMLVHRYHEYSTGVPLHNFVGSNQLVSEYALVWNMIQRYMDTSQPMPDVLALEQSRDKDPVTAAHDKKTNRNPRYWRDMTDDQFEETISQMREQQKNNPATGPTINIFA